MSTDRNPSPPLSGTLRRRGRLRRALIGSALVLCGIALGLGTAAIAQDYGHYRGGSGGPGYAGRDDGGGRPGWFGWHRDDGGHGGWHRGRGFAGHGGMVLTPGRIERMVDRLAHAVDASSEQKQKIAALMQGAAGELEKLRAQHVAGRAQILDALTATSIDRARLDQLRGAQLALGDQASKVVTGALADAAEILTPAQRADLARRIGERGRWHRG
ncbi:MAG: Spy/CpxP family protein refolding chaperone [Proteobacteria bacterium]|nr:Spy/CpxP family protein refolding chaperone [Pseudomonadota bacterium]